MAVSMQFIFPIATLLFFKIQIQYLYHHLLYIFYLQFCCEKIWIIQIQYNNSVWMNFRQYLSLKFHSICYLFPSFRSTTMKSLKNCFFLKSRFLFSKLSTEQYFKIYIERLFHIGTNLKCSCWVYIIKYICALYMKLEKQKFKIYFL